MSSASRILGPEGYAVHFIGCLMSMPVTPLASEALAALPVIPGNTCGVHVIVEGEPVLLGAEMNANESDGSNSSGSLPTQSTPERTVRLNG